MSFAHRFLLTLLLLALTGLPAAVRAQAKPTRILFIGNSLTSVTDIPGRVAGLARAMGKDVRAEAVVNNGYSLEDHWQDGRALAAIRKGGWDVVVLQQGTSAKADSRDQLIDFSRRFAAPIREAGAKPALYMVWPLQDRPLDFPATLEAYRAASQAVDGILLPVGEAWLRVIAKDKRARLYGDAIHQTSLGSDLTVLTIYLSLFPAGPREFDEAYVERVSRALEMQPRMRDLFFDAATLSIDHPLPLGK